MPWAAAAAAVGGALIQSEASKDAAEMGADASNRATGVTREQFEQTRQDQAPYRNAGYSALNRLQILLGLDPFEGMPTASAPMETEAQIRARLLPQFTDPKYGGNGVEDMGLNAAIRRELAIQAGRRPVGAAGDVKADPQFGMLTRPFTGADLPNDPGYQFQLAEGNKAIDRAARAGGRRYSGATLKALERFGVNHASTKFNEAFDRHQITGNTLFNRLSGVAGTGQTATDRVGQAGMAFAGVAGNNMIDAANFNAANRVNQGNIFSNSINQGVSAFQRRNTAPTPWSAAPVQGAGWANNGGMQPFQGDDLGVEYSDARLKTDIKRVGTTSKGFGWYRWKWQDGRAGEGVIAQEVLFGDPSAVSCDSAGFLMVDYKRVM